MKIKPDMCLIDGKIAVFMGADYKLLDIEQAQAFVVKLQDVIARHMREEHGQRRIGNGGTAPTEHAA